MRLFVRLVAVGLLIIRLAPAGNVFGREEGAPARIVPGRLTVLWQVPAPAADTPLEPGELSESSDPSTPVERLPGPPREFDNDPTQELPDAPPRQRPGVVGDWNEADADGEGTSNVIRAHWVNLTSTGELIGRISTFTPNAVELQPTSGLQVRIVRDGISVGQAETDSDGRFVVGGLSPGVYTLVATGARGFIAYALNLLPAEARPRDGNASTLRDGPIRLVQLEQAERQLKIDSAAVPPTFKTLKAIVRDYYDEFAEGSVKEADFVEAVAADQQAALPGADQAQGAERRRGSRELLERPVENARDATTIHHHDVPLLADGSMVGRLYGADQFTGRPRMVQDVNVFIIEDDLIVAQVKVDEFGVFTAKGLAPGPYSLVAAGKDGFGAVGFRLVAAAAAPVQARSGRNQVNFLLTSDRERAAERFQFARQAAAAGTPFPFAMGLIDDPRDIRAAFDPQPAAIDEGMLAEAFPPAPLGNPGVPGSGGFGSGGMSGGGGGVGTGLGALLGLGGLAGLTGLANNDDPALASPFTPNPPPNQ